MKKEVKKEMQIRIIMYIYLTEYMRMVKKNKILELELNID
jgi:hypothetical protein